MPNGRFTLMCGGCAVLQAAQGYGCPWAPLAIGGGGDKGYLSNGPSISSERGHSSNRSIFWGHWITYPPTPESPESTQCSPAGVQTYTSIGSIRELYQAPTRSARYPLVHLPNNGK